MIYPDVRVDNGKSDDSAKRRAHLIFGVL